MFNGCTSLTQAPELPANMLADSCYSGMFQGCTNINYIKVMFDNWEPISATQEWLPENNGMFECPQALIDSTSERSTSTVPYSW